MKLSHFFVCGVAGLLFAGCADTTKSFIRSKDFRKQSPAEYRPTGVASPFANVADMPQWTSDIEGALAFASENRLETVLFFQDSSSKSNAAKQVLIGNDAVNVLDGKQKVTIDVTAAPDVAARFGVESAPTIIKLNSAGAPVLQTNGSTKGSILSVLK